MPEGDAIIPVLNKYVRLFSEQKLPIFASRDWHARTTRHFKAFGGMWPEHCVQGTRGAQFHPELILPGEVIIISKGMSADADDYSAFQAVDDHQIGLHDLLRQAGVLSLFVGGLATDYCVKWTVMDALKRGYATTLLLDAIKGVNIRMGDVDAAIDEMIRLGARRTDFDTLYKEMANKFETNKQQGG